MDYEIKNHQNNATLLVTLFYLNYTNSFLQLKMVQKKPIQTQEL